MSAIATLVSSRVIRTLTNLEVFGVTPPRSLRSHAMRGISRRRRNWELLTNVDHREPGETEADRMRSRPATLRGNARGGNRRECIYPPSALRLDARGRPGGRRLLSGVQRWMADGLARSLGSMRRPRATWRSRTPGGDPRIVDAGWARSCFLLSPHRMESSCWEPLWSAIEETGLPVVMHQGTGTACSSTADARRVATPSHTIHGTEGGRLCHFRVLASHLTST